MMSSNNSLAECHAGVLQDMAARHKDGFALHRGFYTSQAVWDHDIKEFWSKNWIWVGHVSQIPEPGDYFLFEYGPESIIILRDKAGEIRGHVNVCRHRGSRVCLEKSGKAAVFSCPYHAWTYDLEGKLRSGREMADGFDRSQFSLFKVSIQVFQGLILACLSDEPPAIEPALARLAPLMEPFGIENLKIAHSASYPVPANWKLALENYLECYHCAPAHKEYSRSHSLKDPASMTDELVGNLEKNSKIAGLPVETVDESGPEANTLGADVYYHRYPLYPGYLTGSKTGEQLAPLLGTIHQLDGGATDIMIGPLNNFLAYGDHIIGYRFVPVSLQQTDIQIVWMVHAGANDGVDYDCDCLTWLWHVTSQDDERIIRHNQAGVNSHTFIPGPLSKMETGIQGFYHGYLATIRGVS